MSDEEAELPQLRVRANTVYADSADTAEIDPTLKDDSLSASQWERLSGQRDVMIKAMVGVFTWLNGGVFVFTVVAWIAGQFSDYRIVDANTLMALIAATVAQAGIAFVAITRFLFPRPDA